MKKIIALALLLLSACKTSYHGPTQTCLHQTDEVFAQPVWEEPAPQCTIQLKIPKGWRCERDNTHRYAMLYGAGNLVAYIAAPICSNPTQSIEWSPVPTPPVELTRSEEPSTTGHFPSPVASIGSEKALQ